MGKNGEDKLIEEISEMKNTNILILKDKEDIDIVQESIKARNYIKEKYEKIGEIELFDIYKVED